MIAALIEASRFCDARANRAELARMLSRPQYFDVDRALLLNALVGPFESGHGSRSIEDFVVYDAGRAGAPTRAKGRWVFDVVQKTGDNGSIRALRSEIIPKIFREDIFRKAWRMTGSAAKSHTGEQVPPFFLPDPQTVCGAPPETLIEDIMPAGATAMGSPDAVVAFCS